MGGYIFAELPTWKMVFLKSGMESEVAECLVGSVSSLQYDSGNSQPKPEQNLIILTKVNFGPKLRIRGAGQPYSGRLP